MNIDKHIVVKEVGTLTYPSVSPVYKSRGKFHLDEKGYCGYDILIDPPLVVTWKYSEISMLEEKVIVKKVEYSYDFGMSCEFFPEREIAESPDYWKYRDIGTNSPILDIVKRYVEEELMFALHRNPCELKLVHWALRGWLRGRATLPWHNELSKI